jgi:hypothetical protein
MFKFLKSWKTSFCGIVGGALALVGSHWPNPAVGNILVQLGAGFTSLGLVVAKDGDKTSEQVGAGQPSSTSIPKLTSLKSLLFIMAAIGVLASLCCGCMSTLCIRNEKPNGEKTKVCCWVPAWPWQDSSKSIERLTVSSRTNSFQSSLSGLDESQTTSSNAVSLIESVTKGVAAGAVRGALGGP